MPSCIDGGAPSPLNPWVPVPAIVVMIPGSPSDPSDFAHPEYIHCLWRLQLPYKDKPAGPVWRAAITRITPGSVACNSSYNSGAAVHFPDDIG